MNTIVVHPMDVTPTCTMKIPMHRIVSLAILMDLMDMHSPARLAINSHAIPVLRFAVQVAVYLPAQLL